MSRKKKEKSELEMLNSVYVRLRPASRQLWQQRFAMYL